MGIRRCSARLTSAETEVSAMPTNPSYRTIPLSQGQTAIVSARVYDEISKYKWYASWSIHTNSFYARRQVRLQNGTQRSIGMHRQVLGLDRGSVNEVDHINKDTLDNRDENLRVATHSQNLRNRGATKTNTSGFKGVYWDKERGKWRAQIMLNRRNFILGRFITAQKAHIAYCAAARQMHGDYQRTQ